jgi:energy-coupling factor transport system ATP-binding protein
VIRFDHVTVTYPDARRPVLRDVELELPEGSLCLVTGRTGSGKTTLLRAINGLVPRSTGGLLQGRVIVDGHDTSTLPPRELADVDGVVGQDPLASFVTDVVEDELAYGMEQLSIAPEVMRPRVEDTLDLLGIADLRDRPLRDLSGGQQQRVAIGSVLTCHPKVLVLDEPTSALDPTAAEEVLAAITRLVHDLGTTVVLAEHRLERVLQYADVVVRVLDDGHVAHGAPTEVMADAPLAPPVVRLGRALDWSPLPLSVRDARRHATVLRDTVGAPPVADAQGSSSTALPLLRAARLSVRHGRIDAVRDVDLTLHACTVTALMGRNGSGKSSLLWALQGSGSRTGGTVDAAGVDTRSASPARRRTLVGLVPQTSGDLLYLETVDDECAQADAESDAAAGTCRALFDDLTGGTVDGDVHPRDLSEGQRLALVLAVQLSAAPSVVLLDEPTRGLDYAAKEQLRTVLRRLADDGTAVVVATHDVEFVATACDRTVVLAQGEVVADGPTAAVVCASPMLAPQVAKVLAPEAWLDVDAVIGAALDTTGGRS